MNRNAIESLRSAFQPRVTRPQAVVTSDPGSRRLILSPIGAAR